MAGRPPQHQTLAKTRKTANPALVEITLHTRVKELRVLLVNGEPLETAAEFTQREMGLFRDLEIEAVMAHLRDYRATIPAWEFKDRPEVWSAARVEMAVRQGVVKKINVINAMENLTLLQQERIDRASRLEELDLEGRLDPLLGKEIERQRENLKVLAVLYGDVKLLEALREDAKEAEVVEAEVVSPHSTEVRAALATHESRQKVLSILHQLKGIGKGAVPP